MKFDTQVIELIQRTEDVLSIRFERPKGFEYNPGQYMFLTLNKKSVNLKKHFTISSSPTEKSFIEVTKKQTGHEYSNRLSELEKGDKVQIDAPYGTFTFKGEHANVLFLTGGIGITPVRSIIRYCIDSQIESDIVLLYSCRYEDKIAFKEELDLMQRSNMNLRVFYTVTNPTITWKQFIGRINENLIKELVQDYLHRVSYISGPKSMVENIVNILINNLRLPKEQVKYEYFPGF